MPNAAPATIGGSITGVLADPFGVTHTLALEASVCLMATMFGLAYLRWGRRPKIEEPGLAN